MTRTFRLQEALQRFKSNVRERFRDAWLKLRAATVAHCSGLSPRRPITTGTHCCH
jgi:hypothetical protein